MSTSDAIALASLIVALAGAPFTVAGWRRVKPRKRLVGAVISAAHQYLGVLGDTDQARAQRGQARNDLVAAARATDELVDAALIAAVSELTSAVDRKAGDDAVRTALALVRGKRWR